MAKKRSSSTPPSPAAEEPRRVVLHELSTPFDEFFKIRKARVSFEGFDGKMRGPVNRLSLERGDSVAALLHNPKARKVILIEQFRYPIYYKTLETSRGWIVETVAGMVDGEETPGEALKREILEEVGYRVSEPEFVTSYFASPGGSSERIFIYYCPLTSRKRVSKGGGVEIETEDIRTLELDEEEFFAGIDAGLYQDAKVLIAGLWLRLKLQNAGG